MRHLLQVAVLGIVVSCLSSPVFGAVVPVVNGSFESPALSDGATSTSPTGWTTTNGAGSWNPTDNTWAWDGDQVGYLPNVGSTLSQNVGNVAANTTYTLSYAVGIDKFTKNSTFSAEFLLDGTSVAANNVTWRKRSASLVDWVDYTLTYTTDGTVDLAKKLSIRFSKLAGDVISVDGVGVTSVPEPTSLVALAGLGVVGTVIGLRRRRRA